MKRPFKFYTILLACLFPVVVWASMFGAHYPLFDQETLGSELWDIPASVFTSGTYAWVAYGTNTIANDSNSLKITYGNNADGAYVYLRNSFDLSSDLTVGKVYKFQVDSYVSSGATVGIRLYDGASYKNIVGSAAESLTTYLIYFIARSTNSAFVVMDNMGTGESIWIDNLSLKEVTAPDKSIPSADPWPALAGSEAITDSDNRDFADGTINEWVVNADGAGTCVYDAGPGAVKTMMLTSNPGGAGAADSYLYGNLSTADWSCTTNTLIRVQADVRVPAANTFKGARVRHSNLSGAIQSFSSVTTLGDDTWTTIVEYIYISADAVGGIRIGFDETTGNPADDDVMYIDNISIRPVQIGWAATMPMEIDETDDWLKVTGDGTDDVGMSLALSAASDLIDNPTVNTRYQYRAYCKVGTGDSVDIEAAQADNTELDSVTVTSTTGVWIDLFFKCTNAATDKIQLDNLGNTEEFYIRNQSLRLGGAN